MADERELQFRQTGVWPPLVTATTTTPYQASPGETVLVDATAAAKTVDLPTPEEGASVTVVNVGDGTHAVTVDTPGSETINGSANKSLAAAFSHGTYISDGENWFQVA